MHFLHWLIREYQEEARPNGRAFFHSRRIIGDDWGSPLRVVELLRGGGHRGIVESHIALCATGMRLRSPLLLSSLKDTGNQHGLQFRLVDLAGHLFLFGGVDCTRVFSLKMKHRDRRLFVPGIAFSVQLCVY